MTLHHSVLDDEQKAQPKRGADTGDGKVTFNDRLGYHELSGNATEPDGYVAPPQASQSPVSVAPTTESEVAVVSVEPLNDAAKANEGAAS
jgi:hypothetical protein